MLRCFLKRLIALASFGLIFSFIFFGLFSGAALADDTHYQDYIVGGRALSLGGAFTSLGDDPSGLYYNPAGLADVRSTSLQMTASLYGFESGTLDEATALPVPGVENLDIQFTELIIIPASAGFVKTFGEKDNEGKPKQAYALSVVVPSFRSFSASAPDGTYHRRVTDRSLWSGMGYARKLTSRLRVGFGAYYILRTVSDLETLSLSEDLGGSTGQRFRTVNSDISFVSGSGILVGGIKYRLPAGFTAGASITSPSMQIHSQSHLLFTRADSDPLAVGGPLSEIQSFETSDARSETRYAPVLRVGLNHSVKYKYTLAVDASYHMPTSYRLIDVDDSWQQRLPFSPDIERKGVLNFNAGGEFLIVREVSVSAGFFTDFSSAPKIPQDPTFDHLPNVDLWGVAMTMGYFGKHSLSRLGVVYSFGHGQDVIPESDTGRLLDEDQAFKSAEYFQSFFYIFLSSTFRY